MKNYIKNSEYFEKIYEWRTQANITTIGKKKPKKKDKKKNQKKKNINKIQKQKTGQGKQPEKLPELSGEDLLAMMNNLS